MSDHNQIEQDLITLYDSLFKLEDCETCQRCRNEVKENYPKLSRPVTAWFVGNEFANQSVRILFVGKNARGFMDGQLYKSIRYNNVFDYGRELTAKGWAYWNYTGEIINKVYGNTDRNPELTAITNMIKCNNSEGADTTSTDMKAHCIGELQVIKMEIRIIKPTHVVFYTGWHYDQYIDYAFDKVLDKGNDKETKKIGKYDAPWQEGQAIVDGHHVFFLRTCHPERKKKSAFVKAVTEWVNDNKLDIS